MCQCKARSSSDESGNSAEGDIPKDCFLHHMTNMGGKGPCWRAKLPTGARWASPPRHKHNSRIVRYGEAAPGP